MHPLRPSTLSALVALACAGCGGELRENDSDLSLDTPTSALIATLEADDDGPQGFSGRELLEVAEQRFGRFELAWSDTPAASPATDVLLLSFRDPIYEHRRVTPAGEEASTEARDFLQVRVTARIENPEGSLLAPEAALSLLTPDLEAYGAFLVGEGALSASGSYREALMVDNAEGRMAIGFDSRAVADFLEPGRSVQDAPQRVALTRWFESETSSGSEVVYGCGAEAACEAAE